MSDSDPDFDPDKLYDEKQKKYEQVELPFFFIAKCYFFFS